MVIDVKGKFKYKNDGYNERLKIVIKFKLEGEIFNTKVSKIVTSTTWVDCYEQFQNDVVSYLTDKEKLRKEVYSMIVESINRKEYKNDIENEKKKIKELLKDNKFEIKIKID